MEQAPKFYLVLGDASLKARYDKLVGVKAIDKHFMQGRLRQTFIEVVELAEAKRRRVPPVREDNNSSSQTDESTSANGQADSGKQIAPSNRLTNLEEHGAEEKSDSGRTFGV